MDTRISDVVLDMAIEELVQTYEEIRKLLHSDIVSAIGYTYAYPFLANLEKQSRYEREPGWVRWGYDDLKA